MKFKRIISYFIFMYLYHMSKAAACWGRGGVYPLAADTYHFLLFTGPKGFALHAEWNAAELSRWVTSWPLTPKYGCLYCQGYTLNG